MSELSEAIITNVRVRGFRSLRDVSVDLGDLTVLVGPNGSGKSTFLDALAFLQEALSTSPHEAFKNRGGVDQVRTRTSANLSNIDVAVRIRSREDGQFRGDYRVRIRPRPDVRAFTVEEESCTVVIGTESIAHRFVVKRGQRVESTEWVESTEGIEPNLAWNRLALPLLSGISYFAPMYTALMSMCFYEIDREAVAAPNEPADVTRLASNGGEAANVLRALQARNETLYERIIQWLSVIVPGVQTVSAKVRNGRATLAFEEDVADERTVTFDSRVMSEGTLRALALLLSVYQLEPPTLIGLEEPEAAIHPGTAQVLADILVEASLSSQILVTTHSSELINHIDIANLRAVERIEGQTVIAPIVEAQRQIAREGLFDLGELHRLEGLRPETELLAGLENSA